MKKTNDPGLYPSILVHRSNYGQLAIGGAIMNHIFEDEEMAECYQATPASGGWRTRFDGGNGNRHSDLLCHLVAMYVEGLIYISGDEGAYDSRTEIEPSCYAVVMFRTPERKDYMGKVIKEAQDNYVYLWSGFNFGDRVRHDGMYDLKNAFETARNSGPVETLEGRISRHREYGWQLEEREWHIIGKARVPGRIRQILHRTVDTMKETVDSNFGQGNKFFKLPEKRK